MSKLKKIAVLVLAFIVTSLFFSAVAFAQAVTAGAAPDLATLVQLAVQIFTEWKSAGAIMGCVALVNFLTNLTKVDFIDKLLARKFWLRPLVSCILGAALAFLGALATNVSVPAAIIAGLLAGLTSTGLHELITGFNGRIVAERAAGSVVVKALSVESTEEAKKQVEPLKAELDRIALIANVTERQQAIVAWANANPPSTKV